MIEKLKNLVNEISLEYIVAHTRKAFAEKQNPGSNVRRKKKEFYNQEAIDFIHARDNLFLEDVEHNNSNPYKSQDEFMEKFREFGVIMCYNAFEKILKKKNRRYGSYLNKEIRQKGGDAEIDIDYLEMLMPEMRSLNILIGIYNKEYTMDDKELIEFGCSITEGRGKPNVVTEKAYIIPYNLRTKDKITASASE